MERFSHVGAVHKLFRKSSILLHSIRVELLGKCLNLSQTDSKMIVLKLKGKVSESRLQSVIDFLKSMKIDVEVAHSASSGPENQSNDFTLHAGLWKDYEVDAADLRKKAWKSA
jgi:hypothetical protein